MSMFEELTKDVVGAIGGGESHTNMIQAVTGMLNSQGSGGLAGVAQMFEQKGLGGLMSSWVSNGPNSAITPDQMHQVFGSDKIGALAQQLGISPQAAATTLAAVLPTLIDRMTPNGRLPTQGAGSLLDTGMNLLKGSGLFGGGGTGGASS
jgi:uncharacterized protein YidB (DUF937 family)